MFWGLILEPGKRYSQEVVQSFHVSMASLEINSNSDDDHGTVPIMLEYGDGREYLLCNLQKDRNMQCKLDLSFKAREQIGFYSASGKSRVHLTGYLEEFHDSSDEGEEEEEDEGEEETSLVSKSTKRTLSSSNDSSVKKHKLTMSEDDNEEEDDSDFEIEEEDDDSNDEEEEDNDNIPTPVKKKLNESLEKKGSDNLKGNKSKSIEGKESVPQKRNVLLDKKGYESQNNKGSDSKTPKEKQKKKENLNQSPRTPIHKQNGQVKTPENKKSNNSSQKQLHGGVVFEDRVVGKGPVAKAGSKVSVYYVGRLKQNNKQFDSSTSGAGFKFLLGRGEVIKGWDIGVAGMKVGGVRIITIPSNLAYGTRGQPPVIPPNSDLTFEVELRGVH